MIKGMTGFGQSQVMVKGFKATIEVKSLNHRYFDISYYLPTGFGSAENKIRLLAQKYFDRGRITVSVKIAEKPSASITLNKNAVKRYLTYGQKLKTEFNLKNDLTLSDIFKLPGVFEAKETMVDPEELWPYFEKGLVKSFKGLESMRTREGMSLARDITEKLSGMLLKIKNIQSRSKMILSEKKKSLTPEEFSSFQKGCDINEEISRLKHYIAEMKILLRGTTAIGKKLDFIAQEMQRETNTIGSKLQDTVVSNAVIAIKSKIEKIREQSQNIE